MASATIQHVQRALRLFAAGDYAAVLESIRSAEASGCRTAAVLILKARALQLSETEGPISEITDCFEAALRLDPADVDALLQYGWYLLNVLDQPEAAEAKFRSSLTILRGKNTEAIIGIKKCAQEMRPGESLGWNAEEIARRLLDAQQIEEALAQ